MKRILFSSKALSQDLGLFLLRLTFGGIMMFAHGLPKLMKFSELSEGFPAILGMPPVMGLSLAIFAEVFCSALVVLGLLTRLALIPLIITMLVAIFIIHGGDPFGDKEMAILYLIPFLSLFFAGPGKFSLDQVFLK